MFLARKLLAELGRTPAIGAETAATRELKQGEERRPVRERLRAFFLVFHVGFPLMAAVLLEGVLSFTGQGPKFGTVLPSFLFSPLVIGGLLLFPLLTLSVVTWAFSQSSKTDLAFLLKAGIIDVIWSALWFLHFSSQLFWIAFGSSLTCSLIALRYRPRPADFGRRKLAVTGKIPVPH